MQEVPAHQSICLVSLQFGNLQDSILLHLDCTAVVDEAHFRASPESCPELKGILDAAISLSLFLLPSPAVIVGG